jgi:ATP-dependent Zn protease
METLRTAYHEAGHAVLHYALRLDCKEVTVVPDYEAMAAGTATHGGEYPESENAENLKLYAEEAFWLRHAVALEAGAEAVRRAGFPDPEDGAGDDQYQLTDVVYKITNDDESVDLLYKLAHRRAVLLVEHYWPEIAAVAKTLQGAGTLSGEEIGKIFEESLTARKAGLWKW